MLKIKGFYKNFIIIIICFLGILSSVNNTTISKPNNILLDTLNKSPISSDVFDQGIIYSGIQDPLVVNETAIYIKINHYTIGNGTNPEYTSEIAEFPLDSTHDWQGYRYSANITNLVDERDWISNGNFGSDLGVAPFTHSLQTFESSHPYSNALNPDPSVPVNIIATIDGSGCDYMRIHFMNISTQGWYDTIYLWDQSNNPLSWYSGNYDYDILTPWFEASLVKITMSTDTSDQMYGFYIDYYETYNGLFFTYEMNEWTQYGYAKDTTRMNAIAGHQLNSSAVNITMAGISVTGDKYRYEANDESGIYQELSIPRGRVTAAWISMDYLLLRGLNTENLYIFFKIDGQIIYQRGFQTITEGGLAKWQNTGPIQILNPSSVFINPISDQIINLSVGIQSGKRREYSNEDHINVQELYLDNITLILKAEANCTQTDINLKIDEISPIDSPLQWGSATYNRFHTWDINPIQISLTTDNLKIEFDLASTIYAFHFDYSKQEEYGNQGSLFTIYTNKSVHWDTYHRTIFPLDYDNYTFYGIKPYDWEILQIYNPAGDSISFLDGERGDNIFAIKDSNEILPGWYYFKATSTNMIDPNSTDLWNGTSWESHLNQISYNVSNILKIRTELNTAIGNIGNNASTWANLTIYDPNDDVWYSESVHPSLTGQIQFSDITIGPLNTTGGVYQYSIIWTNGTSAGGLNGTYNVQRNIACTILYPRDAIGDMETEEILGDVIPLRLILNDSITGVKLSSLQVQYNWTSGTESLIEISQGIYDGTLDTLDLVIPGYYEIVFTVWCSGYFNLTFTLKIILVEETELKIVGLDNNIDYGTNFTIRISYVSKHLMYGVTDANIALNLSSAYYFVSPEVVDGGYMINISTKDAFNGAGYHDIQINASKLNFQNQNIVTRIQILPRSVYFQISINSADCTFNKSYSSFIKQNLNFSIGVYSSAEGEPVLGGSVYITSEHFSSEAFSVVSDHYSSEVNTSHFGLGVHFISIIFNQTTYQSTSETIMLSISKLQLNASLYNTEKILVKNRKSDFEVFLYVEDILTHLPITDANVSYNWIFGKGFLTNMGDGTYKFEEFAPNKLGAYDITFTISSPNADYESASIIITLVSQLPEGSIKLWWILVPVGAVTAIVSSLLAISTYRHKVLIPKREHELEILRKKTQVFDDIINIKSILIIETCTGRLMFRHIIGGLDKDNEDIFSGFLHAILTLSNRFALKNGELGDKREYAEFTHEIFHVLVAGGVKVIVALILEEESSEELQKRAFKFLDEFESIYASTLEHWNGDRNVFRDTTPKLFEEIFLLSLLKRFKLTEAENIYLIEKSLITTGTISERISQIVKTVSEERHDFRLKTLISLVPKEDQLQAKDIILRFIKNKYLVPID